MFVGCATKTETKRHAALVSEAISHTTPRVAMAAAERIIDSVAVAAPDSLRSVTQSICEALHANSFQFGRLTVVFGITAILIAIRNVIGGRGLLWNEL